MTCFGWIETEDRKEGKLIGWLLLLLSCTALRCRPQDSEGEMVVTPSCTSHIDWHEHILVAATVMSASHSCIALISFAG